MLTGSAGHGRVDCAANSRIAETARKICLIIVNYIIFYIKMCYYEEQEVLQE